MGKEVHLWKVSQDDKLDEIKPASLDLEARLEKWLVRDISVLDPVLLVIGHQVKTDFGDYIDILCLDLAGDLVIVELKRDKTPREVTAQVLDYASWAVDLSNERVRSIADAYLAKVGWLESAFRQRFRVELPETLNGDHRMLVVGSAIDESSERIIKYLSDTHGLNINAALFQYFRFPDGDELLARVFYIEPSEVDANTRSKGLSKRSPNLTLEELETRAADAGIHDLYLYAVSALGPPVLQRHTTRSSIAFDGHFNGSRKTVISLLPSEDDAGRGLHFQLYRDRYAELATLAVEEVENLMPECHKDWAFIVNTGPDWEGFEGFITTREEVDRIATRLSR